MGPVLDNERADAGMANSQAGWYDDPWNPQAKRYWDGTRWTEHASGSHAAPTPNDARLQPERRGFFGWVSRRPALAFWSTVGVVLLLGIGLGAASVEESQKNEGAPSASASSDEAASVRTDLAEARDELSSTQDELADANSEISSMEERLTKTRDKLRDARAEAKRPAPAAAAPEPSSSSSSSGKSFSGNGSKNLGTIVVEEESVIEWTNDDAFFSVNDEDFNLTLHSNASSGDTVIGPGTYTDVEVTAIGNWTIEVKPR
jgi:hypothetical protein